MMTNAVPRTFGTRLRACRERAGLSQEQVAEAIGVHLMTVSRYERGRQDPSTRVLVALSALFDVSIDWLLREHGEATEQLMAFHGSRMKMVLSVPSMAIAVAEGAFSDDEITKITDFVQFVCWREQKRQRENARRVVARQSASASSSTR